MNRRVWARHFNPFLVALVATALLSCKQEGENAEIVIPPGELLQFSTREFRKYADHNYEAKLRKFVSNTRLQDVADITPSKAAIEAGVRDFKYIVPKNASVSGVLVVDFNSKSSELNWRAIVLDISEPVEPSLETTLLYDLIANYEHKSFDSYSRADLRKMMDYIRTFSAERQDLFGVTDEVKRSEVYAFLRNGLSSDPVFLAMLDDAGMTEFDFNTATQEFDAAPYPFGVKNIRPVFEEARTEAVGDIFALEAMRRDVKADARDANGDRLFLYFKFLEDGSLLKDQKTWSWTPSYDASRKNPDGTPYKYGLQVFITDGSMVPLNRDWNIVVLDNNRPPKLSLADDCPDFVEEGATWRCRLIGADPDPDDRVKLMIQGADFPFNWPSFDGITYVADTRVEGTSILVEWTPTNREFTAAAPLKVIQFGLSDYEADGTRKNGDDVKLVNIHMRGRNSKPYGVASPLGTMNWNDPVSDVPRVQDTTYTTLPFDPDTGTTNKRFHFEVVVADDDNVVNAGAPDPQDPQYDLHTLRVNSGGELLKAEPDEETNMTRTIRNINGVDRAVTVFRYSWQPTPNVPRLIASFTPIDDMQNGAGPDINIEIEAEARTPIIRCRHTTLAATTVNYTLNMNRGTNLRQHYITCPTRPKPAITTLEMTQDNAAFMLGRMQFFGSNAPFAMKKKIGATYFTYVEQKYSNIMYFNYHFNAAYSAGTLLFKRTGVCTAASPPTQALTIPANTVVETPYQAAPYRPRIQYKTLLAVTIETDECEAIVPVVPINRVAAVNTMTVIDPMTAGMTAVNLTVRNTAAVDYNKIGNAAGQATVRFTRTNTAAALTIPAGTTVRTNEAGGAQSIVFTVPADTVMNAGVANLDVIVVRDWNPPVGTTVTNTLTYFDHAAGIRKIHSRLPAFGINQLIWTVPASLQDGGGNPLLTVQTPVALDPRVAMDQDQYGNRNGAASNFKTGTLRFTSADGEFALANEIDRMQAPGLQAGTEVAAATAARSVAGFSDIRVRNAAWTSATNGTVEFYRTVAGPNITIPSGLVVATADRKLFQTTQAVVLGASNSVVATAVRRYEARYTPALLQLFMRWDDRNEGVFLKTVYSGTQQIDPNVESAFPLEVTDNNGYPWDVSDQYDRYYVASYEPVNTPVFDDAKIQVCRERTGACTPCNRTPASPEPTGVDPYTSLGLGSLSHHASRFCYIRVQPDATDVANTYRFEFNICDYPGATFARACTSTSLAFYVREVNTCPMFTTDAWAPRGATDCSSLGSFAAPHLELDQSFSEGQKGTYRLYAKDLDKDGENRNIMFRINSLKDLKSNTVYLADSIDFPKTLKLNPTTLIKTSTNPGTRGQVDLEWTVSDADAKRFSGTEGVVIEVEVYDSPSAEAQRLSQKMYLKTAVVNVNNTPQIGSIGAASANNSYTVAADTYFSQSFTVSDSDWASPDGVFTTSVSACEDLSGNMFQNAWLDLGNTDPDVCHLGGPEWGVSSYDPNYRDNSHVANCWDSGLNKVRQDLVVPRIRRTSGPQFDAVNGKVNYGFVIEWCPQKKHIGSFALGIQVVDRGDLDVNNTHFARKGGQAPLFLNVTAPVFLISPKLDPATNTVVKSIRQTAAGLTDYPFVYRMIAKNSKGNPLEYSIVSAPAGVQIDPATGVVTWTPTAAQITTSDPAATHKIRVQVRDTVTNEFDQGVIDLWVQNPAIHPNEQPVGISWVNRDPAALATTKELVPITFTVKAKDNNVDTVNNFDKLFARLYLNGQIQDDAQMTRIGATNEWEVSFDYVPKSGDSIIDVDGPAGPRTHGQHTVRIEITDGNFTDHRDWVVQVRNSVPLPTAVFDLRSARQSVHPSIYFSDWTWSTEVAASTSIGGNLYESLYFTGSYKRANAPKYFLWALDIVNGALAKTGSGGAWNFNEDLTWTSPSQPARRIAYRTDAVTQVNDIFLTNQNGKYHTGTNVFTNTTNSLRMSGDLTSYSSPLTSNVACNGCVGSHYGNEGYGHFLHVRLPNGRSFWGNGVNLVYDSSPTVTSGTNVAGWPAGYVVSGLALNPAKNRLYVSATKGTATDNKVFIYDVSATVASGAAPTLVQTFDVSSQPSWAVTGPSLPGDIATDHNNTAGRTTYKVYVQLRGTGGLVTFEDDGTAVPATFNTIGVGSIPSSASDAVSSGQKLIYDPKSDLFWGVAREAKVVFTLDPTTNEIIQKPTPSPIDSLWVLPSGNWFLIDRENQKVYRGL